MSYIERFDENKERRHLSRVATDILDGMTKLRMKRSISTRRWIWELIQNAKDVAKPESGISIEINYNLYDDHKFIEFIHDGELFSLDNITYLIEQSSSKDRVNTEDSAPKKTGKFGTGFLTTHLLSEQVTLSSFIKEPGLLPCYFQILLDRSARTSEGIIESVNHSMNDLKKYLSKTADIDNVNASRFNTRFRYDLDKSGVESCQIGLEDLHLTLPYVLIFLPQVEMLSISPGDITYRLKQPKPLTPSIQLAQVDCIRSEHPETRKFLLKSGDGVTVIVEIDPHSSIFCLKYPEERLPKIFCDFPLIGTEDFPFPMVVNCPDFNPTEPRDGVPFNDEEDAQFLENKSILLKARDLYLELLKYIAIEGGKNIYNVINTELPTEKEWVSRKWYEENIQDVMRKGIFSLPLVDTIPDNSRLPMESEAGGIIWFPYYARGDEEQQNYVREEIWDLGKKAGFLMPLKQDIHAWQKVLWTKKNLLTIEKLIETVADKQSITGLEKVLNTEGQDTFKWMDQFLDLIEQDENCLNLVLQDKCAIIPNQLGFFKTKGFLRKNDNIENEILSILILLGQNPEDKLLHNSLKIGQLQSDMSNTHLVFNLETQPEIVERINQIIRLNSHPNIFTAIGHLISLFSIDSEFPNKRHQIYQFCAELLGSEIPEKKIIKRWSLDIWSECDKMRLNYLMSIISKCGNLNVLSQKLSLDTSEEAAEWLISFVNFLLGTGYKELLQSEAHRVLPDQNGIFKTKEALFKDEILDDRLKDIAIELEYDYRGDLIYPGFDLDFPENKIKSKDQIAGEIVQRLSPKLVPNRSEETKKVARLLLIWINDNPSLAEKLFHDYFNNQYLLFDKEDMAEVVRKSKQYDNLKQILEGQNCSEEDLKKLFSRKDIRKLIEGNDGSHHEVDIQALLIRLSIITPEEYEKAKVDERTAKYFTHTSTPSKEMFEVVQSLIGRAKENVKKHLESLPDYNCEEWDKWKPQSVTVMSGVLKKDRKPLIVVRPSHGGKAIFYYPEEFEALSSDDYELWVDNDQTEPRRLTLGQILKTNKINRIDV